MTEQELESQNIHLKQSMALKPQYSRISLAPSLKGKSPSLTPRALDSVDVDCDTDINIYELSGS